MLDQIMTSSANSAPGALVHQPLSFFFLFVEVFGRLWQVSHIHFLLSPRHIECPSSSVPLFHSSLHTNPAADIP